MKNLSLTVCVALCSVLSFAGQIEWGAILVPASPDVPYVANTTIYSSYLYIVSGDVTLNAIQSYLNNGQVDTATSKALSKGTSTATSASKMNFSANPAAGDFSGEMVKAFMIITDGGEMSLAQNYLVALLDGTGDAVLSATFGTGPGNQTMEWGNQGSNTAWKEMGAVPEPFSGALALIGLVGIGLKRKFRKQKKA